MKILHIAPTPFFADRGCHMRILGEIKHLQALGHEILLTTYHIGRDIEKININRIINIPWYNKLEAGGSWHKLYLDVCLLWTSLRAFLKGKPHIIHGHLHEGALIGWIVSVLLSGAKIPVIFDVQGSLSGEMESYGLIKKKSFLKSLSFLVEKLICKLPDLFICSSESNKRFINSIMKVSETKIRTVLDGVDTDLFDLKAGNKFKEEIGIYDSKKVVLYSGSLMQSKGIDYLLDAIPEVLKKYNNVQFLIVGHPLEYSQKRAKELRINDFIKFTGKVNYFELPKYLSISDVAVDPKVDDAGEGSGKIINYMGGALPVVCFDTINNKTFLAEKGFYATPRDSDDLAQKIVYVLKNESLAKEAGRINQKRVYEKFSWVTSGKLISEFYNQTIRN
jgi:glycosyltransferase involved in cell wall biosynthesis